MFHELQTFVVYTWVGFLWHRKSSRTNYVDLESVESMQPNARHPTIHTTKHMAKRGQRSSSGFADGITVMTRLTNLGIFYQNISMTLQKSNSQSIRCFVCSSTLHYRRGSTTLAVQSPDQCAPGINNTSPKLRLRGTRVSHSWFCAGWCKTVPYHPCHSPNHPCHSPKWCHSVHVCLENGRLVVWTIGAEIFGCGK